MLKYDKQRKGVEHLEIPQLIIDLAIMLSTAAVVTIIFKKLRLPTILGYIDYSCNIRTAFL